MSNQGVFTMLTPFQALVLNKNDHIYLDKCDEVSTFGQVAMAVLRPRSVFMQN